jgi:hypothetical protein
MKADTFCCTGYSENGTLITVAMSCPSIARSAEAQTMKLPRAPGDPRDEELAGAKSLVSTCRFESACSTGD